MAAAQADITQQNLMFSPAWFGRNVEPLVLQQEHLTICTEVVKQICLITNNAKS